jgi:hypothetical protein
MVAVVFPGNGILSGVHDWDELERQIEEDRKKLAAAQEREAQQEETLSEIERALTTKLRDELAAELVEQKLSPETLRKYREMFLRFKQYATGRWSLPLPYLPASPQVVAAFLTSECCRGLGHVTRLKAAISTAHRSAGLPDPTNDLLVKALCRMLKDNKSPPTAEPSH